MAVAQLLELKNREIVIGKAACRAIGIGSFILMISLGAFVRIPLPFTPVPITLQTFFVLLSGAVMGGMSGVMACLGYIFLGIIGMPIFAGAICGISHIFGPTGGYLAGFVFASLIVGKLTHGKKDSGSFRVVAAMGLGSFIILLAGALWLAYLWGGEIKNAFLLGILPFVPGDAIKLLMAAFIYIKFQKRFKFIFSD